jgi:hypothetical protein
MAGGRRGTAWSMATTTLGARGRSASAAAAAEALADDEV